MTWWDVPPAAPTLADVLPRDVAAWVHFEAAQAGHRELADLLNGGSGSRKNGFVPAGFAPKDAYGNIHDVKVAPRGPVPVTSRLKGLKSTLRSALEPTPSSRPPPAVQKVAPALEPTPLARPAHAVVEKVAPALEPTRPVQSHDAVEKVAPPASTSPSTQQDPTDDEQLEPTPAIADGQPDERAVDGVAEARNDEPQAALQFPLPSNTAALLFPGQGSQYVKMLASLRDNPRVKQYAETARRVLGYDLLEVCLAGPEAKLEETSVCQPAMYLAGLAGLERLREVKPEVADHPCAVAGLSLGEYTALCAAGVFSFEDGLRLVSIRAAAMAEAATSRPQAMLSVAGLSREKLERLCAEQCLGDEVCQIANVLFPKGFACAGTKAAVERLKVAAEKDGALQAKLLKTSGGFHTRLMQPAQEKLEAALKELLPNMKPPRSDVYVNVTGERIPRGTPPEKLVPLLARQLCEPVLWEPSVRLMIQDGLTDFYEVGPMKQLKAMMKRIDVAAWNLTTNIGV